MTGELVDIEMAAHGVTVVEIVRDGDEWQVVRDSRYNRRISPLTEMAVDGPAAGDNACKPRRRCLGQSHHRDAE